MIDGATKILGVLGWPVSHSMSPVMQNAALQKAGINACYLPIPCPSEKLGDVVRGLRGMGFRGANVTIPHKQAVSRYVDGLSETSGFTGSVNTLYWNGSRLMGTTTDPTGAILNLYESGVQLEDKRVALLGTGGAARALGFVLAKGLCPGKEGRPLHFEVRRLRILGRDVAKVNHLVESIRQVIASQVRVDGLPLEKFPSAAGDTDLIINCTPLGMHPNIGKCPLDVGSLDPQHIVYDIVYNPRETLLLREARARGCQTVEGIGMLVHQGAASFRHWFGKEPDTEVMFAALKPYGY